MTDHLIRELSFWNEEFRFEQKFVVFIFYNQKMSKQQAQLYKWCDILNVEFVVFCLLSSNEN